MIVNLVPTYSFLRVNSQASIKEVLGIGGNVEFRIVRPIVFNLLENVVVIHSHIWVFSI